MRAVRREVVGGGTPAPRRGLAAALSGIAFASGCAALLFESLWFRVAGLALGNGLWASSIVLAAFMAGLAAGNGLAGALADRLRSPIRFYAVLELGIGVSGALLVALLPLLPGALAPLLRELRDTPLLLNTARLVLSFALMTVPAGAMGATLPVLVKALAGSQQPFGQVLGRLYGWNTLGAMVGALAGEAWLVGWLGVRGSAVAAGGLDALAALGALLLARRIETGSRTARIEAPEVAAGGLRAGRWLAAAFLSGALFLALEVVWFRFLSLFVYGTSLVFAVLLAVVLAGISLGGLAAGRWIGRGGDARAALPSLALASGVGVLLTYARYDDVVPSVLGPGSAAAAAAGHVVLLAVHLMAPVAVLSGALFTALGDSARRDFAGDARATGLLTLANTLGGAFGSLAGGFVLLPHLGIERSLLAAAAGYALVAVVVAPGAKADRSSGAAAVPPWLVRGTCAVLFAVAWIAFPRGALREQFLPRPTQAFQVSGSEIVAVREGVLQTLVFVRISRFGEPLYYRMFTDGFSMSSTAISARRYMKAYVYLPAAIHPGLRSALLISYGTGSTAEALTDDPELERIDVVDISPDVLDMSRVVYPDPADEPLRDPRVHVHVEDGRFYLRTSPRRYDLVTSEPPPPKEAGVVNLYSREYFELVRRRLAPGGITTYWLPAHNLSESDAKSIIRAFCDVFDDCTLWTGAGLNWMLMGTNGLEGGVDTDRFTRQWRDPAIGQELRDLGFEHPGQLGATFLAGSDRLRELTRDSPPLVDDFPYRLSAHPFLPSDALRSAFHRDMMDVDAAAQEFERSDFVTRTFPASIRDASRPQFRWQRLIDERFLGEGGEMRERDLHAVLSESDLETLPLWMLGSEQREQRIAESAGEQPGVDPVLGIGALAKRDYRRAAGYLRRARRAQRSARVAGLEIYALCMAGELDEASQLARRLVRAHTAGPQADDVWDWLVSTCGLADPRA